MRFDLVVATLNRNTEVFQLLESLCNQTYKEFNVIIVDQNENGLIDDVVKSFSNKLNIIHLKVKFKGLSKARNYGLKYIKSDIIAFPDDDCLYDNCVLDKVRISFENNLKNEVVTVNTKSFDGNSYLKHKSVKDNEKITIKNVFDLAISYTIFIKPKSLSDIYFNEKLGVGQFYGSCEESELLIRLLKSNYYMQYFDNICIYHPDNSLIKDNTRAYKYSLGFGAVHKIHNDLKEVKYRFVKYLIANIFKFFVLKDVKITYFKLKGKVVGYLTYK